MLRAIVFHQCGGFNLLLIDSCKLPLIVLKTVGLLTSYPHFLSRREEVVAGTSRLLKYSNKTKPSNASSNEDTCNCWISASRVPKVAWIRKRTASDSLIMLFAAAFQ